MTDDDRPTCLRSTNYGGTWEITRYHPRSPLAAYLAALGPGETYDDGRGNLYRLETS